MYQQQQRQQRPPLHSPMYFYATCSCDWRFWVMIFYILFILSSIPSNQLVMCRQLDKDSFGTLVGGDLNLLIKFYAPWCKHCVTLEPTWKDLMEAVNSDVSMSRTIVARVDCTKQSAVCNQEKIQGYPTIKIYRAFDKTGTEYEGPRDLKSLLELLKKQLDVDVEMPEKLNSAVDPGEDEEELLIQDQQREIVIPDPVSGLHDITDQEFESFFSSGRHFVMFFAPWCGHCQRLEPTWLKLAESMKHDGSVAISRVDCDKEHVACKKYGIKGYPTLLWIIDGKVLDKYQGPRTHEDLKIYISEKVAEEKVSSETIRSEDYVLLLTDKTFTSVMSDGVTLVKFMTPWCTHCKRLSPTIDALATKLASRPDVKIAKVDCSQFDSLCTREGVDGYPTLNLYKKGQRIKEYEGERSLESMHDFILEHLDSSNQNKDEL